MTTVEEPRSTATVLESIERHASVEHYQRVELDDTKLQLIKNTLAKDAALTDDEMQLYGQVATRKGLDPFAGQIHVTKRMGKLVFQTGIDGFRLIAQRTGLYAGQDAPEWCGPDGVWSEIWPKSKGAPVAARIAVYRKDWQRPVVVIAHWDEYVQTKQDGGINAMWKQRGPAQLAKCAEALALRKAFPQDMSGIYTDEEMGQADNPVIDVSVSEVRQGAPKENSPSVQALEHLDMTAEVAKLHGDEKKVLKTWWAETMPRADMPKGCTAKAVPEHRVQEVRAKLKEIIDARGPDKDPDSASAPVAKPADPDDEIIEAEVVEDVPSGSQTRTEAGQGGTKRPATPSPAPASAQPPGKDTWQEALQQQCRAMGIDPAERNRLASKLLDRSIRRPSDMTEGEIGMFMDFLETGTYDKVNKAVGEVFDAFPGAEPVDGAA